MKLSVAEIDYILEAVDRLPPQPYLNVKAQNKLVGKLLCSRRWAEKREEQERRSKQ